MAEVMEGLAILGHGGVDEGRRGWGRCDHVCRLVEAEEGARGGAGGWRREDDEAGCDQGEPVGGHLEAPTQGPDILGAQGERASGSASATSQAASTQNLSVDDILMEVDEPLSPSLGSKVCTQEQNRDLGRVAEVAEVAEVLATRRSAWARSLGMGDG
ncbi:hypothetical protein CYMTET_37918 [Cymbomonas tetramitiformis]|uniref:Uncharacterized protein n=1 Tax=Cymbomonas tetramitiformis TaxID=36881 RepID=A0AAE0CCZ9_9CHLO|nr:hypothetical protein CYMTET_37918 [Cymbomonas tetramitiformis]